MMWMQNLFFMLVAYGICICVCENMFNVDDVDGELVLHAAVYSTMWMNQCMPEHVLFDYGLRMM